MTREDGNELIDQCVLAAISELPIDQLSRGGVAEKATHKFLEKMTLPFSRAEVLHSMYEAIAKLESEGRIGERRVYVVLR